MGLIIPTQLKMQFKDSGTFVERNSSEIVSNGFSSFVLNEKFQPYDDVTIINLNSSNDCTIFINGRQIQQPLPKGNSVPLNHTAIRTIEIKNIGTTSISANEIEIYYRHTTIEGQKKIQLGSNISSIFLGIKSFFR